MPRQSPLAEIALTDAGFKQAIFSSKLVTWALAPQFLEEKKRLEAGLPINTQMQPLVTVPACLQRSKPCPPCPQKNTPDPALGFWSQLGPNCPHFSLENCATSWKKEKGKRRLPGCLHHPFLGPNAPPPPARPRPTAVPGAVARLMVLEFLAAELATHRVREKQRLEVQGPATAPGAVTEESGTIRAQRPGRPC